MHSLLALQQRNDSRTHFLQLTFCYFPNTASEQGLIIGITSISIGELLSGFRAANNEAENRKELNIFLDSPRVTLYPVDEVIAEYYSAILSQLKMQGTPIPTNDIWIAAVAFQHGLQLYSLDKHFSQIKGLLLRT